jgi:hypothetical protein
MICRWTRTDTLYEFLLDFHGRRHWYEGGYFAKFEIRRVKATKDRPHGLRYSFTLHAPDGRRLVGFDNAHPVGNKRSRSRKRAVVADHWHRTQGDPGRPYQFENAARLIEDFFNEIARVLTERDVTFNVIADDYEE